MHLIYFNSLILSDAEIGKKCLQQFSKRDCIFYMFRPIKVNIDVNTKQFIKLRLNYFYISSQHIEKVSTIEMFFNFCSLIYLYSGISFNFLLRKLNNFIKGLTFRLIYTVGLILLQFCMVLQMQSIFQLYEENSNIPSIYTITTIEAQPPALSLCFYISEIRIKEKESECSALIKHKKNKQNYLEGLNCKILGYCTYNLTELIKEISFVSEELEVVSLKSRELELMHQEKKFKNLLYDDFFFNEYRCFTFHLIYNTVNRYEIRLEDMFNIKIKNQDLNYLINIHQSNDFTMNNINKVDKHTNIDIKYRQNFYSKSLDVFEMIRSYEHKNDNDLTDFERLYDKSQINNQTTLEIPVFRKFYGLTINNTYFRTLDNNNTLKNMSRWQDYRLRKRIELPDVNISYDILVTYINFSKYDIR